jgi:hypothetical protein
MLDAVPRRVAALRFVAVVLHVIMPPCRGTPLVFTAVVLLRVAVMDEQLTALVVRDPALLLVVLQDLALSDCEICCDLDAYVLQPRT